MTNFKTVDELKELLHELGHDDTVVFDSPSYLDAIIGLSDEGALCYSYEKMIECLMKEDNIEYEEAMEFIDYNTIRALPYTTSVGTRPIIIYDYILNY